MQMHHAALRRAQGVALLVAGCPVCGWRATHCVKQQLPERSACWAQQERHALGWTSDSWWVMQLRHTTRTWAAAARLCGVVL